MKTKTILGQPSWELSTDKVRLHVTRIGGHMAPVHFLGEDRDFQPYSVAPWAEEGLPTEIPQMLRALRGDFFCLPFGGNATSHRGERHPPHGETANAEWTLLAVGQENGRASLHLETRPSIRNGRVEKVILLRRGESVVYTQHIISEMSGPMCMGHHQMLKFPEGGAPAFVSTSRVAHGQVAPVPFERPEERGYQSLKPAALFSRLNRVPSACGEHADLSRFPARRGFEDLVMLVHESEPDFAWTAVVFPDERRVWFSLKDPRVLRSTILWHSNGGRHYPPWNGRHVHVLGLEDVTSYFHYGLAESVKSNSLSQQGIPTSIRLDKRRPLVVNLIQGVAEVPANFGAVKSIVRAPGGIRITNETKSTVFANLDPAFLNASRIQTP